MKFNDSSGATHYGGLRAPGTWQAIDGSGYQLVESTGTAINSEGVQSTTSCSVVDPNGNCQTSIDTLGRSIPVEVPLSGTAGCNGARPTIKASSLSIPSVGNSPLVYTFCYADVNVVDAVTWSSDDDGPTPRSVNGTFLQQVILPDLTSYSFEYLDGSGDLSKLILPSGGTISYQTANATMLDLFYNPYASVVNSRSEDAKDGQGPQTTTYSYLISTTQLQTTVRDPAGDETTTDFICFGSNCIDPATSYPSAVKTFSGSAGMNRLIKEVDTSYQVARGKYFIGSVFPVSIKTTLEDGMMSEVTKQYDPGFTFRSPNPFDGGTYTTPYGNVVSESEYDFGQGAPGPLLRRTETQYKAFSDPNYLQSNLLHLPSQVTVYDGAGSITSQTSYGYDEAPLASSQVGIQFTPPQAGVARGNLTSVTRLADHGTSTSSLCPSSGSTIVTRYTYFDTGELNTSQDACGGITTTLYDPAYAGAYPTSVSDALRHLSSKKYDYNSGRVLSTTDVNNDTTSYSYNDPLQRMTNITFPDVAATGNHGQVNYSYTSNSVQIERLADPPHQKH